MERDAPTSRLEMLPQAFEIAKNAAGNARPPAPAPIRRRLPRRRRGLKTVSPLAAFLPRQCRQLRFFLRAQSRGCQRRPAAGDEDGGEAG